MIQKKKAKKKVNKYNLPQELFVYEFSYGFETRLNCTINQDTIPNGVKVGLYELVGKGKKVTTHDIDYE